MGWPDFSELSFGFAFLREFERRYTPGGSFLRAPDFISQAEEATKGYDVSVLADTAPVFLQFKRSFVLTTRNANEVKRGHFASLPVYRMHLHPNGQYRQHRALQDLEAKGFEVYYVTSQVESHNQLSNAYLARQVVDEGAALFLPSEITLPDLVKHHHVSFRADLDTGYVYSEQGHLFERAAPTWERAQSLLSEKRRTPDANIATLKKFVDNATRTNRSARRLADRLEDPVAAASVIAFSLYDLQLTFFGVL